MIKHTLYEYTLKKWKVYVLVPFFLLITTIAATRYIKGELYYFMMSGNTGVNFETDKISIPFRWISYWIVMIFGNMVVSGKKEDKMQSFVRSYKRVKWWMKDFLGVIISSAALFFIVVFTFELTDFFVTKQINISAVVLLWWLNLLSLTLIIHLVGMKYNSVIAMIIALMIVLFPVFINQSFLLLDCSMICRVTQYSFNDVLKNVLTNILVVIFVYLMGYNYVKHMEW